MKLPILFILLSIICSAQYNKHWDVSAFKRVTFPAASVGVGCISTTEGVACISDASGTFLFSTDGVTVKDRLCNTMPNGTGLFGGISSTQSAVIVPLPNSSTIYYVFTADQQGGNLGIHYSIVDMSLNGSFGAVTTKNVPLAPWEMSEKLCAVKHCNNRDVWVISKGWMVNTFTAWLLTPTGITTITATNIGYTPVSTNGSTLGKIGQLKANAQGTMLAAAYYGVGSDGGNRVEVYSFNNVTGSVTSLLMNNNLPRAYGVEFSPDGSRLYAVCNTGEVYQYNVCNAFNRQIILAMAAFGGSIQNALDGRMYIARGAGSSWLAAINNPNALGISCGLVLNAVNLTSNTLFGLPNFISSYDRIDVTQFNYIVNCNDVTLLPPTLPNNACSPLVASMRWEKPLGNIIGANLTLPNGIHNVSLIIDYTCYSDTITQMINVGGLLPLPNVITY